jgi:tetratricopeptide (TPR) repeat protein
MQLCGDLWMYWHIRGKNLTARKYAASFIEAAASAAPSTGRAGALITAGLASWVLGRYEQANQEWDQAYRSAAELEAEREIGISALLWGLGLLGFDLDAALTRASESIERSRSAELTWVEGLASTIDGILHTVAGDLDTAGARYRGALAIQERLGDLEGAGLSLVPERVSCPPARIAAVIGLGEPAGWSIRSGHEVRDRHPAVLRRRRVRSGSVPGLPRACRRSRFPQCLGAGAGARFVAAAEPA